MSTNLEFEAALDAIEAKINKLEEYAASHNIDITEQLVALKTRFENLLHKRYDNLVPWQRVLIARHAQRPLLMDYIGLLDDFLELHGDRACGEDKAIVCGFALLAGEKFMLIGHCKGKGTREKIECNFGMGHPQGYRKALRCMKLAEKFGLPVVTFIDTPGAYPGVKAEKRGQAYCIAVNLLEMARLRTPILVYVLGEGGSGGALGIGVGDRVLMLENAYYSVISPEGCAAILWKDAKKADEASRALKLTVPYLKELGVIDEIVPEPLGGAHRDVPAMFAIFKENLLKNLRQIKQLPPEQLLARRYAKLRAIGIWATLEDTERPAATSTTSQQSAGQAPALSAEAAGLTSASPRNAASTPPSALASPSPKAEE